MRMQKPTGDMEQAFLRACQLYHLLTANNFPRDSGWELIHYFESLGYRFDRLPAYDTNGWGHASMQVMMEYGMVEFQNAWNDQGAAFRVTPEQLENQIDRALSPAPTRMWEPASPLAGLEAAFPPPYTRREYNPEFVINNLPDRNQLGETANHAIAAAGRRIAEEAEQRVILAYSNLRMNGQPIGFTQDDRGHVRFDQPVNVRDGDQLRIDYTVTLEEELPDI